MECYQSAVEPTTPIADGRGLIGGRGEDRVGRGRAAPLLYRCVLQPYEAPPDLAAGRAFFAEGPVEVEIGFARGHFFKDRMAQAPGTRFLGFEVRRMWVEQLARWIDRRDDDRARLVLADARPLLEQILTPDTVTAFHVFFPDPWWKKRHEKRRVMTSDTVRSMHTLLAPGGSVCFRTDVPAYFEVVNALLSAHGGFEMAEAEQAPDGQPLPWTHRQQKCAALGIAVHSLRARKR